LLIYSGTFWLMPENQSRRTIRPSGSAAAERAARFDSAANASDLSRRPAYQPEDEQQYDRADKGNEDRAAHSTEWSGNSEHAEEPAADERANDTDDNVTDDAVSGATHDERSENSSDETNYDPGQDAHGVCPQKIVEALRLAPVHCYTAPALPLGPKIGDSFTVRYTPLAFPLRPSAFEWLDRRADSRTFERVTTDHFGIADRHQVTTATTPAEVTKPSSGVAGSSSACYPSQPVPAKFK
jgi:hypothetical protein